jgi:hypothetical protein
MSTERRRDERYELRHELPVFKVDSGQALGHLADVTTGGLLLQSEAIIKLQREYFLEIRLVDEHALVYYNDGSDKQVRFHAYSLWQMHDGSMYRTGFRITDISPAASLSLSYLICKFRKKHHNTRITRIPPAGTSAASSGV